MTTRTRCLYTGLLALLVLCSAGATTAQVQCPGNMLVEPGQTWRCLEATATATLLPTATPTPAPPLIEGVPVCPDHDPTRWHPLVQRAADDTLRCTYGHEHHDDPTGLDGVFGPLPWGTISYPWETLDENHNKHNVYKWATYENPTCQSRVPGVTLRAARLQYHGDGNMGARTRFHSFFLQSAWCDTTDPTYAGQLQTGGWMDYGILMLGADATARHLPLPGDPPPTDPAFGIDRRLHGSPDSVRGDFTWYGAQRPPAAPLGRLAVSLGIRNEDWGPVNTTPPNLPVLFYGPPFNNSWQDPLHLLGVYVDFGLEHQSGYADRYGAVVAGCAAPGLDCVPFSTRGMRQGAAQFRSDVQDFICCRDYDVPSPVTGNSLIHWPN